MKKVRGVITKNHSIVGAYMQRAQALCEKTELTYNAGWISKIKFRGNDSYFEFELSHEGNVAILYIVY